MSGELTIIAKNTTVSSIDLSELGITVAAGGQETLTDMFDTGEIDSCNDLRTRVSADDITINDGTSDLSISDGLDFITVETRHPAGASNSIIVEEDGSVVNSTVSTVNFATNLNVVDNGSGKVTVSAETSFSHVLDYHTDVPTKPTDGDYVLVDRPGGTLEWVDAYSFASSAIGVDVCFNDDNGDWRSISNTTYTVVGTVIFPGTASSQPNEFKIIASRGGASGTATCRLYDLTNGSVIAEIPWSTVDKAAYSDTPTNLPVNEAIFEIQAKKDSGSASKSYLHYVSLRRNPST